MWERMPRMLLSDAAFEGMLDGSLAMIDGTNVVLTSKRRGARKKGSPTTISDAARAAGEASSTSWPSAAASP